MEIIIILIIFILLFYTKVFLSSPKFKGNIGEKEVNIVLKNLGENYFIHNDILIKTNKGTSQIDHVVVSPYGIFVIETKNYQGIITGGEKSEYWKQNIWGNKFHFKNPMKQNWGHIYALKEVLPQYSNKQYISVVVFTNKANLRVSTNFYSNVITIDNLYYTIHRYGDILLSEEQIVEIRETLNKLNITDANDRRDHIKSVQQKQEITYQKVNAGICPKCGGTLILRKGKYGEFYGCSNYPKCKYTLKQY